MEQKTLYTAIGRLERETNGCGRSCPVIRLGGQPYMVDMQELVVWTALNWRISKWEDISFQCDRLASSMGGAVSRPWDACVNRLLTRGLLVSGCGETEYDALYVVFRMVYIAVIAQAVQRVLRTMESILTAVGLFRHIETHLKLIANADHAGPKTFIRNHTLPPQPAFAMPKSISDIWPSAAGSFSGAGLGSGFFFSAGFFSAFFFLEDFTEDLP